MYRSLSPRKGCSGVTDFRRGVRKRERRIDSGTGRPIFTRWSTRPKRDKKNGLSLFLRGFRSPKTRRRSGKKEKSRLVRSISSREGWEAPSFRSRKNSSRTREGEHFRISSRCRIMAWKVWSSMEKPVRAAWRMARIIRTGSCWNLSFGWPMVRMTCCLRSAIPPT